MANWTRRGALLTGRLKTFCAGLAIAATTTFISAVTPPKRFASRGLSRLRFGITPYVSSEGLMVSKGTAQPDSPEPPEALSDDQLRRYRWRYKEARRAGMDWAHAKVFAGSDFDIEEMRALARKGCPPHMLLELL